ncbi:hypothetical protein BRADI_1g16760v3 [Brachypodium distachyon]|uniref:Wound-induced protein 1 n=1 Tax=Brachypodium distachyon TaxID=15368 RepID=A0A0Q3J9F2_BRADI|nr:hypothetical protein BRADI_1g16760v3 [Brachypodium distachyon]
MAGTAGSGSQGEVDDVARTEESDGRGEGYDGWDGQVWPPSESSGWRPNEHNLVVVYVYRELGQEELANPDQLEGFASEFEFDTDQRETAEQRDKFLVLRLYEALGAGDRAAVHSLLAPDLEWWFHGPPKHQHMMHLLTGTPSSSFAFVPHSVDALPGSGTVIAEGAGEHGGCYWVHAWTVGPDGVITQLREYFNTDLTVTRLLANSGKCCVWQSRRPDQAQNSLPCLLLAL